jgi:hypothetical protein
MIRKRYFEATLIVVIVFLITFAAFTFFNFDHLTSGKLRKVEVVLEDTNTNTLNTLITFTDSQDLRDLTSIFFGKFNESIFGDTADDSLLSVVFTFEKKDVEFKVFSSTEAGQKKYTYSKYPDRKMRFSFSSNQGKRLLELIP